MQQHLRTLLAEPEAARELAEHGRRTVLAQHTCHHRVDELLAICAELGVDTAPEHAVPANTWPEPTPAKLHKLTQARR
jgi:spore maturation protein CgeB